MKTRIILIDDEHQTCFEYLITKSGTKITISDDTTSAHVSEPDSYVVNTLSNYAIPERYRKTLLEE